MVLLMGVKLRPPPRHTGTRLVVPLQREGGRSLGILRKNDREHLRSVTGTETCKTITGTELLGEDCCP